MSFSFRNIFSPDDPEFETSDASAAQGGFSAAGSSAGRGNLEAGASAGPPTQTFLASELLPYIPKAIAAQSGIPMEREVHVPLPSDGTLDVPLSAIYQICPELFAAEITPLNDSVVTLPPRLGATPATTESAPAFAQKPFAGKVEAAASPGGSEGNPFWSPLAEATPSLAAKDNPFSSDVPPVKNAFADSGKPVSEESGKGPAGFEGFAAPKSDDAFGSAFPGFAPFEKPAAKDGAGQGFSTLFSKQADADADLPFPGKPAFSGGAEAPAKEPEGVWGAMFSGKVMEGEGTPHDAEGVADAPFESIGKLLNQAPSAPQAEAAPVEAAPEETPEEAIPSGFEAPFASPDPSGAFAAGFTAFSPASADEARKADPSPEKASGVTWSFGAPTAPANPPAEAFSSVPAGFDLPEFPAAPAPAPTPAPPVEPAVAVTETAAPFEVAEDPVDEPVAEPFSSVVLEPVDESPAPPVAASVVGKPEISSEDERDLELRAIFSTSESFNLSKVARKVVALPGIQSCSLSLPGKLVQASRKEENRVGDEAREMVATLRSLAKLTGLPEARTFTLQTDRGVVSLFLDGECCITVHHDASAFQPGVREKLILVARNLAKLRD